MVDSVVGCISTAVAELHSNNGGDSAVEPFGPLCVIQGSWVDFLGIGAALRGVAVGFTWPGYSMGTFRWRPAQFRMDRWFGGWVD